MKAYVQAASPALADRDQLITDHVEATRRIVLRVARRCPNWISVDDLLAAGFLGLTEAAERYDKTRGEPFLAFAEKRIRGAALDELRRGDFMPRRMRNRAQEVGRAIRKLEHTLGRSPNDSEIAAELDVSVEKYHDSLELLVHASLGALDEDPARFRKNTISGDLDPEEQVLEAELKARLVACLPKLPRRDVTILALYYNEEFTYAELGDLLGVSISRICQLHARALTRLRAELEANDAEEA